MNEYNFFYIKQNVYIYKNNLKNEINIFNKCNK